MNYYNFHIGDYAAHTKHLSLLEDLAYRRMIDAYYLAERPFIGSSTDVAREIGMRDQMEAVEYVLSKFFTKTEDGFSHGRCDDEIAHYQDKRSKASNAGKASAERRNNIRSTSVGNNPTSVGNFLTDVQPTNNQEPITNNQVNPPSLRDVPPSDSAKSKSVPLTQWMLGVKERGEKLISDYAPLLTYCESVGLPFDWIEIAWIQFRDRYTTDEKCKRKRYTDWRRVFKRAVEENWLRLWFFSEKDQAFKLSTVGVAADLATREAA